jgi:hypothetical protein
MSSSSSSSQHSAGSIDGAGRLMVLLAPFLLKDEALHRDPLFIIIIAA